MEITLSIPQNKWAKPTEVRQEVVQAICDAFLKGSWWYPYVEWLNKEKCEFAKNSPWSNERHHYIKFHEVEMHTAFKALRKAGYLFIKHDMSNGTWYRLTEKNYSNDRGNYIVIDFCEQWD